MDVRTRRGGVFEDERIRARQIYRDLDGDADIRTAVWRLVQAATEYDRNLGRRLPGMWTMPIVKLCTAARHLGSHTRRHGVPRSVARQPSFGW